MTAEPAPPPPEPTARAMLSDGLAALAEAGMAHAQIVGARRGADIGDTERIYDHHMREALVLVCAAVAAELAGLRQAIEMYPPPAGQF